MNRSSVSYYLRNPKKLLELSISQIERWLQESPYSQPLHALLAKRKYIQKEYLLDPAILDASAISSNRTWLYRELQNDNTQESTSTEPSTIVGTAAAFVGTAAVLKEKNQEVEPEISIEEEIKEEIESNSDHIEIDTNEPNELIEAIDKNEIDILPDSDVLPTVTIEVEEESVLESNVAKLESTETEIKIVDFEDAENLLSEEEIEEEEIAIYVTTAKKKDKKKKGKKAKKSKKKGKKKKKAKKDKKSKKSKKKEDKDKKKKKKKKSKKGLKKNKTKKNKKGKKNKKDKKSKKAKKEKVEKKTKKDQSKKKKSKKKSKKITNVYKGIVAKPRKKSSKKKTKIKLREYKMVISPKEEIPQHMMHEEEVELSNYSQWLLHFGDNVVDLSSQHRQKEEQPKSKNEKKTKTTSPQKKKTKKVKNAKKTDKRPNHKANKNKIKIEAQKSLEEKEEIISELWADLLAKQGHIKKALKMYSKLSLKYPEKSSYFASKLENLKKKNNND